MHHHPATIRRHSSIDERRRRSTGVALPLDLGVDRDAEPAHPPHHSSSSLVRCVSVRLLSKPSWRHGPIEQGKRISHVEHKRDIRRRPEIWHLALFHPERNRPHTAKPAFPRDRVGLLVDGRLRAVHSLPREKLPALAGRGIAAANAVRLV